MPHQQTRIHGLYAITNHGHLSIDVLLKDMEAVLKGGASIIQFRDKHSSTTEKEKRAVALQTLCADYQSVFIINDDVALCKKINADGIHLGTRDISITEARKYLGNHKIIGATCHSSLSLALQAQAQTANYIALGKFFPSLTKDEAPLASINCIAPIQKECHLPIVAIGGITLDNAPALIAQNVQALAVINDLFSQTHIEQRAQQFCSLFKPN